MGLWPCIAGTLILRALDLITIAVPPGLPACLALAMCVAMWRLGKAGIDVAAPQKLLLAGSIDTCMFDKTGTLTDSGELPSLNPPGPPSPTSSVPPLSMLIYMAIPHARQPVSQCWGPNKQQLY